jgi:hypothetical protein
MLSRGETLRDMLEIFPGGGVRRFSDSGSEHSEGTRGECQLIPRATGSCSQSLQQFATLSDELTYAFLFRPIFGRIHSMLPTRAPRSCQTLRGTRARTGAAVHPTPTVPHGGGLTCRATTRLRAAPRSGVRVTCGFPRDGYKVHQVHQVHCWRLGLPLLIRAIA